MPISPTFHSISLFDFLSWYCVLWILRLSSLISNQVDELLKQRDNIHSTFTIAKSITISGNTNNVSNGSTSKIAGEDSKAESPGEDGGSDGKDKSGKKKWFNLNLKGSDKRS